MSLFEKTIITEIQKPFVAFSEKGRVLNMKNRPFYGLSFCIDGQITYNFNGQKFVSDKNNVVLLPQSATYSLYCDDEGLFPLINFKAQNFSCDTFVVIPLNNPTLHINNFKKLSDYFLSDDNSLKIFSLFYSMLEHINLEQTKTKTPLYPVINYLEKNISNPEINNEILAKKLCISEVYLRKLFLTHYKTTPKQYILDMRIQKAKQLLENGMQTITSISEQCGFSSVYHFCRIFKEKTGFTPSEYSKNNRFLII